MLEKKGLGVGNDKKMSQEVENKMARMVKDKRLVKDRRVRYGEKIGF